MSASRDQSQKVAFVYSNLYRIYQKGKNAAVNAADAPSEAPVVVQKPAQPPVSSNVLKAEDLHRQADPATGKSAPKVSAYNPAELIGKRFARPGVLPAQGSAPKHAIVSLKDNLKALNDLHSRLRFMLQELEDLVRE